MKKNLLYKEVKDETIERLISLKETSERKWGSLTSTEMLLHCNKALKNIIEAKPNTKNSSIRNHLLRIIFLKLLSKFPKGAPTKKDIDVKGSNLVSGKFEDEKQELIDLLTTFQQLNHINAFHPFFVN